MFGYDIEIDSYTDSDENFVDDPGDSWNRPDTYTSNYFVKVFKSKTPEIASSLDIPIGAKCYAVWVVWSSGDSFGHDEGAYTQLCGVFLDFTAARELETAINEAEGFGLKATTSDGQEFQLSTSWNGYFDSLDAVHIESTVMQ